MRETNGPISGPACIRCQVEDPGDRTYCRNCGQLQSGELNVVAATMSDRTVATLTDLLLILVTFGIGWLIWTATLSSSQQTPGKRLVGIAVRRKSGQPASPILFVLRDLVLKPGMIALVFTGYGIFLAIAIVNFLWPLLDRSGQSLIDRLSGTIIVRLDERWRGKKAPVPYGSHLGQPVIRSHNRRDRDEPPR
jgi:uncharacterized RDD family membrane protein YckC